MTDWTPEDLDSIAGASQIEITTLRGDGSARSYVPIWVVRAGDDLFVRSYRGSDGGWYRHACRHPHGRIKARGVQRDVEFTAADATAPGVIDAAYRDKYGSNGYVDTMIGAAAAATTMKLTPGSN